MAVLSLENICFSYGNTPVLSGISYEFEKGKMYCITGKSGAGKTTLVNLMSLLVPNSSYLRGDGNGKKIEFEDLPFLCVKQVHVYGNDRIKLKNGICLHKDGTITVNIDNFISDGYEMPHSIWIAIAQKRTPEQMKKIIESLL